MQENLSEALWSLREKPIFATTYERITLLQELYPKYQSENNQPVRFGMLFRELMQRVSIPLKEYDLFPGRVVEKELTEAEEQNFRAFLKNNPYVSTVFCCGHRGYDWENLVRHGLSGIRLTISERVTHEPDEDKRAYLTGMDLALDGVQKFILRYEAKARETGLIEVADALNAIAKRAPESFYEALLLCWIFFFIDSSYITHNPTVMIGRLDKILIPYYEADIKNGRLTRDKAKEYILDFYCKHNLNMGRGEHQMGDETNSTTFSRVLNFDAPQYLEIAGTDEDGNPVCNELTQLFIECLEPGLKNPVVMPRYFKGMNEKFPEFWQTVCSKALKSCSIIIYNDDDTISAFCEQGVPLSDAREYEHFGCNWCHGGQNSFPTFMNPPLKRACPGITEAQINELVSMRKKRDEVRASGLPGEVYCAVESAIQNNATDIDYLYDVTYRSIFEHLSDWAKESILEMEYRNKTPSAALMFGDCISRYSISKAASNGSNAVKYHPLIRGWAGFGTAVDMLCAIDWLVYKNKKLTLTELHEAVKSNFKDKKILALCKKSPKYGTDDELAVYHSGRFANLMVDVIKECNRLYDKNGIIQLPSFQSDTTHLKNGVRFGATHDGRLSGEAFSQNSNPTPGSQKCGVTGMLGALSKMPFNRFVSGALNVDVNPKDYEGDEGTKRFASVLGTYFNSGGLHAQVSAVSVEALKDAQINPQNHGDLLVRVTGYSGVFVDICKTLQDDIIRRTEN